MGTRAIVVVTGRGIDWAEHGTIRLYNHWAGEPTHVLGDLVLAVDSADQQACNASEFVRSRLGLGDGETPRVPQLPAQTFALHLLFAGRGWHGSSYRVDTDEQSTGTGFHAESRTVPAQYHESLARRHYGDQGDLEWMYVVDLRQHALTVYGGEYGDPDEHLTRGPVDPRSHSDQLLPEYQDQDRTEISAHMDELMGRGWTITPPSAPVPPATAPQVGKRRKPRVSSVYKYIPVGLLDQTADHLRQVEPGSAVRVVQPHGCPRNGAMDQYFVESAVSGEFIGLVCSSSLQPLSTSDRRALRKARVCLSGRKRQSGSLAKPA